MSSPGDAETILAERGARLVGFAHVAFDEHPRWGSLVDNLHVADALRRTGIGTRLLQEAGRAVAARADRNAMYLWVLQQNVSAQQFYRRCGATQVETAPVSPPGGDPARLCGQPRMLRMTWPDVTTSGLLGSR